MKKLDNKVLDQASGGLTIGANGIIVDNNRGNKHSMPKKDRMVFSISSQSYHPAYLDDGRLNMTIPK